MSAVFAWDARGHGRTPGERGYAPDFATMVDDVDCFIRHISETYHKRIEDMVDSCPKRGRRDGLGLGSRLCSADPRHDVWLRRRL